MSERKNANHWSKPHLRDAYRSGLEERNAEYIHQCTGTRPAYERYTLAYTVPSRIAHYTPDFILPNGIIVETKGRFVPEDRQKHILIKRQYPELDIRFVFTNSRAKLYKGSKTSYADWCFKYGFKYADKVIPKAWFSEVLPRYALMTASDVLVPKNRALGNNNRRGKR